MHSTMTRVGVKRTGWQIGTLTVLTLVILGGYGCGDDDNWRNRVGQSSLVLMQEATDRARAQYPDALLIQIVALPGPEGLVDADDTDWWEFDFAINDLTEGLVLRYEDKVWSDLMVTMPFFGVVYEDLNRITLDLAAALARLREHGYEDAYNEWNLFQPLVGGNPPPFYYFFGGNEPFAGVILRVNAFTGEVEYDSPPGETGRS